MSDQLSNTAKGLLTLTHEPLHLSYEFCTPDIGENLWEVLEVEVHENIDEPHSGTVFVLTKNLSIDPNQLIGTDCTLIIHREPLQKKIGGIIQEATFVQSQTEQTFVKIHFAPAFNYLKLQKQSRIFQNMTIPEILEKHLGNALAVYGREIRSFLTKEYTEREYTTQYNETDFAFFTRLMQEEGISYHFYTKEKELLILTDSNATLVAAKTIEGEFIPFFNHQAEYSGTEHINHFTFHQNATPTSIQIIEHEWSKAGTESSQTQNQDAQQRERQIYIHDRNFNLGDYNEENLKYHIKDQELKNTIRLQSLQQNKQLFFGSSNVIDLSPALTIEMQGHPSLDGQYAVLSVEHHSRTFGTPNSTQSNSSELTNSKDQNAAERYSNHFVCMPLETPYSPPLTHSPPSLHGVLTATVVGPEGEEIHTDEHGRIKIQFHWDREGKNDDHSSCWVRVAQGWAGQGWGFLFIPRIGMEVVVTFIEGDPDRPIVSGCLYNGKNTPPYPLPDDKTKSTIKSNSSLGGDGFNEIRFEDAKKNEEIFIHAQKNMVQKILNNRSLSIGNDENHTIGNNQTLDVKKDQTIDIRENKTSTVHKNQTSTIKETLIAEIGSDSHNHQIRINERLSVELTKELFIHANDKITFQCGKSVIEMTPEAITMRAKGKDLGAKITLNENANIISKDKSSATLNKNITLENSQKNTIAISDANITADADSITLSGKQKVNANTGESIVETSSAAVKIKGGEVNVNS